VYRDGEALACRAAHVDGDLANATGRQRIEQGGKLSRDARPDEHIVDTCQHGAISGRRRRHLDLLQVVDTD